MTDIFLDSSVGVFRVCDGAWKLGLCLFLLVLLFLREFVKCFNANGNQQTVGI